MRRFLIRNAAGEQIGWAMELPNGEIEARLPVELDGAPIGGEFSRWEDLEVATWAIEALDLTIERVEGDVPPRVPEDLPPRVPPAASRVAPVAASIDRARVYKWLGMLQAALNDYDVLVAANPDDEPLRNERERVQQAISRESLEPRASAAWPATKLD